MPATTLTPHLSCRNAAAAIEFYKKAFGAETGFVMDLPDGQIMHAALTIDGASFYVVDEFPDQCGTSPQTLGGTPVTLHLQVADVDAVFQRAVDAGCEGRMAPQDMFWGDRYGMAVDPYGHNWSIATTIGEFDPNGMQEAIAYMASGEACPVTTTA